MRCCPANDGDDLPAALGSVAGLDFAGGLLNSAGKADVYLGMLRRFVADSGRHEAAIRQSLASPDGSVGLHAMKGLFATLGARDLCAKAGELELARKNGDADLCQRETRGFCLAVREFRDGLRRALPEPSPDDGPKIPVEPVAQAEKLAELRAACLQGDCDAADALSAQLWTFGIGGAVAEICCLADSLDYDLAAKKIDDLLGG